MRVELDDFNIEVEADNTEEHPKVYENIHLNLFLREKTYQRIKLKKQYPYPKKNIVVFLPCWKKATSVTYDIVYEEQTRL